MKTKTRLEVGDPCLGKLPGLRSPWFRAVVREVLPKGYRILRADGFSSEEHVKESACKRMGGKFATAPRAVKHDGEIHAGALDMKTTDGAKTYGELGPDERRQTQLLKAMADLRPRPAQPKPQKAARSAAYLDFVRSLPCCNPICRAAPQSEAHHEGRRGVGQKCSDFLCVPLCHRCHDAVTNKHALPSILRFYSIEETKVVLRVAQCETMLRYFAALKIEDLADALAQLDEKTIRKAVK